MAPVIFFSFEGSIVDECEQIAQVRIEGYPHIYSVFYHTQMGCPIINPGPGFDVFGINGQMMAMRDIFNLVGLGRGFTFEPNGDPGYNPLDAIIDALPLFQGTFWAVEN